MKSQTPKFDALLDKILENLKPQELVCIQKDISKYCEVKFKITDEDIKGINPLQRVVAMGILYDKERLESGKSTANINVVEVTGTIADLQSQADLLRKQL